MEEQLRGLWAECLDRSESDIHNDTNFFDAGGDSVAAIRLSGLANKAGTSLHAQTIFSSPVFSEMANSISLQDNNSWPQRDGHSGRATSTDLMQAWDIINTCLTQCDISNHALEDIAPCTPYQAELMRASHDQNAWLFQAVLDVGEESLERAKETLQIIRDKTPAFRTRIVQHEKGLFQVVLRERIRWVEVEEDLETYKARDAARRMW